jgi:hypothetical protein
MQLAHQQKIAALRFHAYLMYWQKWVIDNDFFSLFYFGVKWNQEIAKVIEEGGRTEDLVKLEKQKREIITKIKEGIESLESECDNKDIVEQIAKLPSESLKIVLEYSKIEKQNIIEGKTFLTDQEAAILGISVISRTVELKMSMISAIDKVIMILLSFLDNPADFDIKKSSKEISEAIWDGIVISKHIDSLSREMRVISGKSIVQLTRLNIIKEF